MFVKESLNIWLSAEATDMRKAIDGLCFLVVEEMELEPNSGALFLFYNRSFNKLKVLYWDSNGFCLWYKRLEKHRFKIPKGNTTKLQMTATQLRWLLDGLDFSKMQGNEELRHDVFF